MTAIARLRPFLLASATVCAGFAAVAAPLSDSDLYFDPGSISPDFYARYELPDLSATNTVSFLGGVDPVVDVDILPTLRAGTYGLGYVFSQSDYLATPNVDYGADITGGDLTASFLAPGLYHMRVTRGSGASETVAVLAEAAIEEKSGKPDKSGANKKLVIPDADLYLIDNGAEEEVKEREKILDDAGQTHERVSTRAEAVEKIKAKSKELGRKIHVEFAGHGAPGNASTGAGKQNIPDKQIDLTSVADFQKMIDEHVDLITFYLMCSVGAGDDGMKFLQILADSIGKASGWDSTVTRVDSSHYTVGLDAKYVTKMAVPLPPTMASLLGALALLLLKRLASTHPMRGRHLAANPKP